MPIARYRVITPEAEAVRWTGDNEREIAEFVGRHRFQALDSCSEDIDATAEFRHEETGAPVLIHTGDWIVRRQGLWAYPDDKFRAEFMPA